MDKFKQGAKCKYHHLCDLFNNSVIKSEIEESMCGIGQEVDPDYVPKTPKVPDREFKPTKRYGFGSGLECDSYTRYKDQAIVTEIVEHLRSAEKLRDLVDKHGYW